jgi:hypothetical protein
MGALSVVAWAVRLLSLSRGPQVQALCRPSRGTRFAAGLFRSWKSAWVVRVLEGWSRPAFLLDAVLCFDGRSKPCQDPL